MKNHNQIHTSLIKEVEPLSSYEMIQRCYSLMKELRPHLEEQKFAEQVSLQMTEGYRLAYLEDGKNIKALAGFRILRFLVWGKVLYIDDLITSSDARGKGYGGKLLNWLIDQAKLSNCDQVHLDSGPQRHDAHRLYLNHKMKIVAHHFALDLRS